MLPLIAWLSALWLSPLLRLTRALEGAVLASAADAEPRATARAPDRQELTHALQGRFVRRSAWGTTTLEFDGRGGFTRATLEPLGAQLSGLDHGEYAVREGVLLLLVGQRRERYRVTEPSNGSSDVVFLDHERFVRAPTN